MARRTADYSRMLEEERLILAAAELIYEAMNRSGVTKAELARRIGKTRGHCSADSRACCEVPDGKLLATARWS